MALIKNLIPGSQYSTKCPYLMTPKGICIHNTANDAPAINERNYMARADNQNEVSFHIAVDDNQAIQCVPFNRNTWHAGDGGSGQGNRNYIAVEICYSRSGGERFIKAEQRAAKEVAALLKQYGWGISQIRKHQDFSGKYCPHRTLDMGWQRFLNMIQAELNLLNNPSVNVKEEYKMKYAVCYCNEVDEREAKNLRDYLGTDAQCFDARIKMTNWKGIAPNIIAVGGNAEPVGFSSHTTHIIKGDDRYDTRQKVLSICEGRTKLDDYKIK
ncbi:N-acetylmuramoyl-L-alanine amidase [Clostridium tertium]|uniref:peptidoglycan recognition protein family protein n=1 Tax=Clostridium tertium TaxID=1559 RepID=UPI00325C32B0